MDNPNITLYQEVALRTILNKKDIVEGDWNWYKGIFKDEKNLVKTPLVSGINFLFSEIERSQSIFVDTEE
ncbi:hypothetical protein [Clostridium isatidis]|uniref:Uncharacterized protein n=1 Tax=Clostridium isatidis TaxID=182773 RepID=A0A343JCB8_9CLOT|nr:hypothetical protein [Clostridium isatidis]ASW43176.1 hypothetical protein BEN51_06690 [Clostridium isatidis]